MTDGARGLSQHLSMVESYRERKRSGLSGLSLRFDASYGSGALRPITCRYGLSRGSGSDQSSPGSTSSSAPGSADLRSPLLPWDSRPGSSDIVQAAQERNTRKETKGRALGEAHRALSDPFTLGRGQPSLAELAGQWQPLPPVQQQPEPTDDYDIMRRPGGERKLRPMRVQEHRAEDMMVRGHGLDMTRHAADKGKFGISQQGTREEKAEAAKAAPGKKAAPSDAEKEQQRIRATMASMRNELMGVGAEPDAPPLVDGQRSSGLLEEAASRGARMRQSRELRLTGGVQSTSDPSWGQRKVVAPRRSTESTAPTEPGAPDLFTRIDPREAVARAAEGQPITQSALGFDSWTVRRSSLRVGQGAPAVVTPSAVDDMRQQCGDLEIVDDDTMGDMMSNFGAGGGKSSVGRAPVKGAPISEQEGCSLKELMFGSTGISFTPEWTQQNFGFNKTENITYGIVQHKGGPCGVLAVVQAYIMKVLLFGSRLCNTPPVSDAHEPAPEEQRAALAAAITEILWKCGHGTGAVVALSSGRSQFPGGGRYKSDGITETLQLQAFSASEPLLAYVLEQLQRFQSADGSGCILLTYSAVLSRGVENVKKDMDVPTNTVIGRHGYCTQELVNLLLTGSAASNVFNGIVKLGEGKDVTVLRGVDNKSEIGLLSLFEHYKSCEVGSNMKAPMLPIWVILSESHFTCLFAADRRLCADPPLGGKFDLFYYDMLARQDDQIRLTVEYGGNPNAPAPPARSGDLVPPLEHCIRTRWAGATVSWNGYEPIL